MGVCSPSSIMPTQRKRGTYRCRIRKIGTSSWVKAGRHDGRNEFFWSLPHFTVVKWGIGKVCGWFQFAYGKIRPGPYANWPRPQTSRLCKRSALNTITSHMLLHWCATKSPPLVCDMRSCSTMLLTRLFYITSYDAPAFRRGPPLRGAMWEEYTKK